MTTLIDSNILIDIFGNDPIWYDWSASQIRDAIARGTVIINDVVYAEASIRYDSLPVFEEVLTRIGVNVVPIPREALFLAGKVFAQYRQARGTKPGSYPISSSARMPPYQACRC